MAGLMILNPKRRRKAKAAGTGRRRRKMTAKQLRYFGPRKSRKAAAPKRKRRAATSQPGKVVIIESNPKGASVARKRKGSGKRRHHRRKNFLSNPKRRRRFRRNPRIPGASIFNNAIVPGMIGAAGALGVDVLMASVPMPAQFKQGAFVPVVKIGVALLIGMAVGAMSNREAGEEAAAGGVIVTLYGLARNFMMTRLPSVPLGRYVPMRGMGWRGGRGMKRYVPLKGFRQPRPMLPPNGQRPAGLGYIQPARIAIGVPSRGNARYFATR
jgi:hypothetical protein